MICGKCGTLNRQNALTCILCDNELIAGDTNIANKNISLGNTPEYINNTYQSGFAQAPSPQVILRSEKKGTFRSDRRLFTRENNERFNVGIFARKYNTTIIEQQPTSQAHTAVIEQQPTPPSPSSERIQPENGIKANKPKAKIIRNCVLLVLLIALTGLAAYLIWNTINGVSPIDDGGEPRPSGPETNRAAVIDDFGGNVTANLADGDIEAFKGLALVRRDSVRTSTASWSSLVLDEDLYAYRYNRQAQQPSDYFNEQDI